MAPRNRSVKGCARAFAVVLHVVAEVEVVGQGDICQGIGHPKGGMVQQRLGDAGLAPNGCIMQAGAPGAGVIEATDDIVISLIDNAAIPVCFLGYTPKGSQKLKL